MNHSLMGKYITVHTCIFWYHVPFCRTPLCRSPLLISLSTHYSFHLMSVYIKKIFLFYIEKYFLFSMAKFDQTSHIEYLCVKGFCDQVFDQRSRLKSPLCKILVWCTFSLILVYGSYFTLGVPVGQGASQTICPSLCPCLDIPCLQYISLLYMAQFFLNFICV